MRRGRAVDTLVDVKTTVLRASMADLIALSFYRVGCRPRESLVIVGLSGPRHRVGVVTRIDIPPAPYRRAALERTLRLVGREGGDEFVAMIVSDARPTRPTRSAGSSVAMPHRGLVRDLRRQARRQSLRMMDVLAVGDAHWRSYLCADDECCPAEGFPLEEALSGPAAAWLVSEGEVLARSEADLLADVDPDPAVRTDRVVHAGSGPSGPGPGAGPGATGRSRPRFTTVEGAVRLDPAQARAALDRWRRLLARPSDAEPGDLAWIADVLVDHWLRDSVLLTLVPGSGTVPDDLLAGGDPAAMDAVFQADPDADLLERGRSLLAAVARSVPAGRRADALALLAWASWYAGHGLRARLLAHRALADVPTHRLARLVDQILLAGVAPAWVERRRPVPRQRVVGCPEG